MAGIIAHTGSGRKWGEVRSYRAIMLTPAGGMEGGPEGRDSQP